MTLAKLGYQAAAIAFEAAKSLVEQYEAQNRVEPETFAATIHRHIERDLQQSLADSEYSWQQGSPEVAITTFVTSMRLAGYRAAQEYLGIR